MAHWVGMIKHPVTITITGKSKEEIIFRIGSELTNKYRYPVTQVTNQLKNMHENPAVAYAYDDDDDSEFEVAKVFSCNCGSVKRHEEN